MHSFVSNSVWNHDVEDNAYALMRTADGIVAMLHSSATQWRHRFSLEITLEQAFAGAEVEIVGTREPQPGAGRRAGARSRAARGQ